ncbi:type IV secretion system DNA-binding domain-containing protein [Catellatospora sp. NPDC049111]|uniref:type IV secretory system conjugative DNA transfer family protein n=1 Tax=Catellatospora sp. NPDC049111 TaxID=3155271 RepID=UPI0033D89088
MNIQPPITLETITNAGRWLGDRPWLAVLAGAAVLAWIIATDLLHGWRHRRLSQGATLLTIAPPPQVDTSSSGAWWQALSGVLIPSPLRRIVYGTPHVVFEYTWQGRHLQLRLWVPGTVPAAAVQSAIRTAWPGATVTAAPAAAPIPASATVATGGRLHTRLPDVLPLRTEHAIDPVRGLLAAGAETHPGEHTVVQILARPAAAGRVRNARRAAHAIRTGQVPPSGGNLLARMLFAPLMWLIEMFLPGPASSNSASQAQRRDPTYDRDVRLILDKALSGPVFEVDVRYIVATPTGAGKPDRVVRERLRQRLNGLAHAVASAFSAYSGRNSLHRRKLARPVTVAALRRMSSGFLASIDELAALAALPTDLAVPGLQRARAKTAPAPVAVPSGGGGTKPLGVAQDGGHKVAMPVASGSEHIHLIGKTGSGKSTLITHMVLDDVRNGRGAVVIDPKGDLVNDILSRLPDDVADRVVLIDPAQDAHPCFNPLDGDDQQLAVDNIVGIFGKIFHRFWGPRIDDVLRVSLLTLLKHDGVTLSAVPPLLNSDQFRARFTAELNDPAGLHGFWTWYDSMNPGQRAQIIGPVLARLRAFLLRDFVRATIGQPKSSFDLGKILDGGLLLARLPKGVLGDDTCRILGSLLIAKTWQAATARSALPEQQRRPAMIYADEAHNFLNLPSPVGDMLAEARGYRLGMLLAHQDLSQLPRDVAAALHANARNKIFFNVAPDDARVLARHVEPELDEHDLSHLDAFTAAARLVIGHGELPAFTFTTPAPATARESTYALRQALAAAHPPQPPAKWDVIARGVSRDEQQRRSQRTARRAGGSGGTDTDSNNGQR